MAPPQPGSFAQWLKQQRARLDLTQEALAELAGCAVYIIRTYEIGTRRPSLAMAEHLAEALQLPADERPAFLRLARAPLAAPDVDDERTAGETGEPSPAPSRRPRLPVAPYALVGRAEALAALRARLAAPDCRLLTILGPGGVGKTRIALQLAADLAGQAADETVWVDLAPLTAASQLPAAIADALGAPVVGAAEPVAHLLAALRDRRALLVLDNFEQIVEGATLLSAILREAPGVRLLVTSRERLRVQGEWVHELNGLDLGPAGPSQQSEAALLFLERARQADPSFALGPENQAAVATICRLLDGLPLGIELAAAWVRALPCAAIADELARSLDFLALAGRDVAPGHRSLRAVFERSWGLLGFGERAALARLSVFHGGCDLAAATAVTGAPLPALAALVDASLVRRAQAGGGFRYTLHEVVRQYAAERLREEPIAADVAARHAAHFAGRLEHELPALQSGAQPAALARLRPDLANIWAAWSWAVEQRNLATLDRMGRGVVTLCEDLGRLQEGARLFGEAADALEGVSASSERSAALGRLRGQHGYFLARCGRLPDAERRLEEALRALAPDDEGRGPIHTHLALVRYQRGAYAEAVELAQAAAAALRAHDDQFYLGLAACFAGMACVARGEAAEAAARLEESAAVWGRNGYPRGMLLTQSAQSALALGRGEPTAALPLAARCVQLASAQRDRWGMAFALVTLAAAALAHDDLAEAGYLYREGAEAARELGEQWVLALALLGSGWAALAAGEPDPAGQAFCEAAGIARAAGLLPATLEAAAGLAQLVEEDNSELRLAALALACQHPASDWRVRSLAERQWQRDSALVEGERAAAIWAVGPMQPPHELVERLALAALRP